MYLSTSDLSTLTILIVITCLVAFYVDALARVNDILSYLINNYLIVAHPIRRVGDTIPTTIPTCPYRWPNGQGDVAKFLQGERNSHKWAQEFGWIYRIWSGVTPEIVLTRPEDVKTAFRDSDQHCKGVNNDAGWLMGELLGSCLGLISGADWRQVRATTDDAFARKAAVASVDRLEARTRAHFAELLNAGPQSGLGQDRLNPVEDLRYVPFWMLADHLYGDLTPDLRSQLATLIPLREALFRRVIQGGATRFGWSRFLPTQTNRQLRAFQAGWKAFNDAACARCRLAGENNTPVVRMYDACCASSSSSGSVRSEHVLQTLDEVLFANLDVTIGGISWNLLFLAAHGDVQAQLREEMAQAMGPSSEKEGRQRSEARAMYFSRSDTLLAASIREAARLRPAAAFSIPQAAPTDRIVSGYLVPAGTNFVVDTHALNIHNPFWGHDSKAYRPARFLCHKASELRYQYWRFGFGPRQCLGKYIADLIIGVIVAHLVEHYQLSLDSESTWDRDSESWIAQTNTTIRCKRKY